MLEVFDSRALVFCFLGQIQPEFNAGIECVCQSCGQINGEFDFIVYQRAGSGAIGVYSLCQFRDAETEWLKIIVQQNFAWCG